MAQAQASGRPVIYLNSSHIDKEPIARDILAHDGVCSGLVCVLSSVEPCWSFDIHRNREKKKLELQLCRRKCLFLYHYQIHPVFGFLHARIQTWFPFPHSDLPQRSRMAGATDASRRSRLPAA